MSAVDMSLLTKEIKIQLSKATRGGICKNSDNLNNQIPIQVSKRFLRFCRNRFQFTGGKKSEIWLKMAQLRTKNLKGVRTRLGTRLA